MSWRSPCQADGHFFLGSPRPYFLSTFLPAGFMGAHFASLGNKEGASRLHPQLSPPKLLTARLGFSGPFQVFAVDAAL